MEHFTFCPTFTKSVGIFFFFGMKKPATESCNINHREKWSNYFDLQLELKMYQISLKLRQGTNVLVVSRWCGLKKGLVQSNQFFSTNTRTSRLYRGHFNFPQRRRMSLNSYIRNSSLIKLHLRSRGQLKTTMDKYWRGYCTLIFRELFMVPLTSHITHCH